MFSYASGGHRGSGKLSSLDPYAIGSLNTGISKGTTYDDAVQRFREQLIKQKNEFSAYVDESGYIHALASSGTKDHTGVLPSSNVKNEKGITTIIHNHPHFGGRIYGGTFSEDDLQYVVREFAISRGKINTIIATAKEGIYTARVSKNVSERALSNAYSRAEKAVKNKRYLTRKAAWADFHGALAKEMGKKNIGIQLSFSNNATKKNKLVTQKLK